MVSIVQTYDSLGKTRGNRNTKRRRDKDVCVYVCVPLALEGEDGEERITGFFRLLLGL